MGWLVGNDTVLVDCCVGKDGDIGGGLVVVGWIEGEFGGGCVGGALLGNVTGGGGFVGGALLGNVTGGGGCVGEVGLAVGGCGVLRVDPPVVQQSSMS